MTSAILLAAMRVARGGGGSRLTAEPRPDEVAFESEVVHCPRAVQANARQVAIWLPADYRARVQPALGYENPCGSVTTQVAVAVWRPSVMASPAGASFGPFALNPSTGASRGPGRFSFGS